MPMRTLEPQAAGSGKGTENPGVFVLDVSCCAWVDAA